MYSFLDKQTNMFSIWIRKFNIPLAILLKYLQNTTVAMTVKKMAMAILTAIAGTRTVAPIRTLELSTLPIATEK